MWDSDWVNRFLKYTSGQKSPEIFRKWTAISLISASVERRVWSNSLEDKPAYANQFIMLVARPGKGKEIIKVGESMLRDLSGGEYSAKGAAIGAAKIKIGSHDLTTSSLIDEVADSMQQNFAFKDTNGRSEQYSFLSVFAEELGVFLKTFDNTFITTMTALWSNYPSFQQKRRTGGLNIDIINPSLNLLIGATPRALGEALPDVAWGMGFMGRMLMVYSDEEVKVKYFTTTTDAEKAKKKLARKELTDDLFKLTALRGQFQWEQGAVEILQAWDEGGCQPRPKHSKLEDYCSRRAFFTIKLAMVAALSARGELIIRADDYNRALDWLLEIEALMPDVFRAMLGRSDKDVMEECHTYCWAIYTKQNNKPIRKEPVRSFLKDRVPSEKVNTILNMMIESDLLQETPDELCVIPLVVSTRYGIE
jgi:hypothetical protein